MLRIATASNYEPLRCVKPLPKSARHEFEKRSIDELSMLHPQSVLRASDAIGWQNVRAIHFRHSSKEMVMPASDDHCIVLNLGIPFFTHVFPGKRRFQGQICSGEVAIIPA